MMNANDAIYQSFMNRDVKTISNSKITFSSSFIFIIFILVNINVMISAFVIGHVFIYKMLLMIFYSACLLPLLHVSLRNEFDLFSPIVLFNFYLFFQQGVWTQLILSGNRLVLHASLGTVLPGILKSLILSVLGVLAFDAAYLYRLYKKCDKVDNHFTWNYTRLKYIIWIMALIAFISFFAFLHNTNLAVYLHNINSTRIIGLIGKWSYVALSESALTIASVFSLLVYARSRNKIYLILSILFMLLGVAFGLLIGYRITSAMIFLVFLFLYHQVVKNISLSLKFILFIAVLYILSSAYAQARAARHTVFSVNTIVSSVNKIFTNQGDFNKSLVSMAGRLEGSEVLSMAIQRTNAAGGYQWGWRMVAQIPFLLIPRFFWPGNPFKKENAGELFDRKILGDMYYSDVNSAVGISGISPTWFGEMYWNFGFVGTVLTTLGLGYLSGGIFSHKYKNKLIGPVFSSYFLMGLVMLIEAPSDAIINLIVYILPVYLIYIICRSSMYT